MLHQHASETLSYQREVDKGKFTIVVSFEKLTFVSPSSELQQKVQALTKGSRLKCQLFKTRYGS